MVNVFISKIQSGPLKISSVSEVMKESKQPASQVQKQKGDTPASTTGIH
jgi:mitofilin